MRGPHSLIVAIVADVALLSSGFLAAKGSPVPSIVLAMIGGWLIGYLAAKAE